jgi:hypothetical protein
VGKLLCYKKTNMDFAIVGEHTNWQLFGEPNYNLIMINKVIVLTMILAFTICKPINAQEKMLLVFENMKHALMESDEEAFQTQWYSGGYQNNLVGGSGISGSGVYKQGSREKWYLKPVVNDIVQHTDAYIIPCKIWAWENEESLDFVYAAALKINEQWLIIGAGEDLNEVKAMIDKFPE